MPVTRIKNNQITDNTVNAASKLQDFSITSLKIANNLTYGSDFTIAGNLTVQGNVTAIDTVDLVVEDPLILLAKDQTGVPSLDIGFIGKRGDEDNIAFVWDESTDRFVAVFTTSEVTNTTIAINSYASLQVLDLDAANLNITGNTVLGNLSLLGNVAVDMGNSIISNVAEPLANSDVATKFYVDQQSASGFTIEDDAANTTQVSGGDILTLLGTADEITVLITDTDEITFGLTANVTIADNLTVTNTANVTDLNASSNVAAGNAVITNDVSANTGTFTGNVTADTFLGNIDGTTGTFTGNVDADTFLGNIDGATGTFTGNVTGDTFLGNIDGTTGTFTGNVDADTFLGNIDGATGTFTGNVTGDTFLGNIDGTTGTFTGNVDADTFLGNIDGATGTFTGNVTGDTFLGNIDGTTGTFTSNVSAANVDASTAVNTDLIAGTGLQIVSTGDLDLQPSGNITVSGVLIRDVGEPLLAQDAATKQYVDDAVSSGIHIHTPVLVETPVALPAATYAQGGTVITVNETIAGNTVVFTTAANLQVNDQLWFSNSFNGVVGNLAYFVVSTPNTSAAVLSTAYNGTPVSNIANATGLSESVRVNSGIGATLTANVNGALSVDGVSVSNGDRVLVYQQVLGYENGVYDVTDAGNVSAPWILTRSSDTDTYEPQTSTGLDQGSYFYVQSGDTGAGESYVKTEPPGPFIIGLANIVFTQFSASQVYSANTQAGLSLTGTVFSAKVDNDTTAFDGGGNISVKAGANLTTPNIGNATGNSLTLSGNGLVSAVTVSATGNVSGGNVIVTGIVSATGNVSGGNITTAGSVSGATGTFTGNVTADTFLGNIDGATGEFSGNVTVDTLLGNIDGATGTFTGNVSGDTFLGNIDGATGTFTGNVSGDTFLGNIDGATGTFTGNVTGDIFLGNIDGATGTFTGNVSGDTFLGNIDGATGTFTGNVTADTFLGNIDGATGIFTGNVGADYFLGNIDGATGTFTGNIGANYFIGNGSQLTGISTSTNQIFNGTSNVDIASANANITMSVNGVGNVVVVSQGQVAFSGNLLIVDDTSDTVLIGTDTPTTNAALKIGTTNSIIIPVGSTAERPGTPVTGMVRFNTSLDTLEFYDSDSWTTSGAANVTVITADSFSGDGSTVAFTLTEDSTTAATIVSINGVVQEPTVAYAVAGNVLTFTEAPESTDVIDARILQTTVATDVLGITNAPANASITGNSTQSAFDITGNLIPTANITYDLGSPTAYWNNAYFSGNTIFLGPLQLKAVTATEFGVFQADGTTTADLDVGNIDVSAIIQGNTVIGIAGTNGNAYVTVDGTANVLVVSNTGANITGAVGVTGNVTAGNVSGTNITGTLTTAAQTNITSVGTLTALDVTGNVAGGNLSGTNIVGTLTTASQPNITSVGTLGSLAVTGNISGNFILGNGSQLTGIDATSIQNGTSNVRVASSGGNVVAGIGGTDNILIINSAGANITGALGVTGNISAGNVSGTNLTGTLATAAQPNITSVGTLGSLAVTGNISAGNLTVNGIESVGTLTINNDATIVGNLTVQGNTITANVTSLVITDPIINLGRGANNTPLVSNDGLDRGVEMFYFTTTEQMAFMGYDNDQGRMILASNASVSNNVVTVNNFGTTQLGTLVAAAANVTGNITSGNLSGTNIVGTLTTAAQTNITSVGNLTAGTWNATTIAVARGGTGATTAQGAINTLAGAVTSGQYLRGNGTNVLMSAIQAGDVPTLNQSTTGSAATLTTGRTVQTNLASTSTATFDGSANITPGVTGTLPVGNGGTGATSVPTNGQLLIGNGTNYTVSGLTGTTNRVTVTNASGSITLSGPQDLATSSNVQFGSLGVGTAASGTTGEIRATNNITAFYSDQRLKTDIQVLDRALDRVCAISGVTFRSNDVAAQYGYRDDKTQVGVIAQEVRAVLPEIVVPAPFDIGQRADGTEYSLSGQHYMTVQYEKLVPLLIQAIKELRAEVKALTDKGSQS